VANLFCHKGTKIKNGERKRKKRGKGEKETGSRRQEILNYK
jgi:hypothetical protein